MRLLKHATVVATLFAVISASAQDQPILTEDGELLFPEGARIPASLTEVERAWLEANAGLREGPRVTPPPTGPIYCPPEYAPMDGILIAWEGFSSILSQMAFAITVTADSKLYVCVDNTSERTSASNTLASAGCNMNNVEFVVRRTDTVWIRDYGPRYIYEGDVRAIVDHTYNRPRPNDNLLPSYFGNSVKQHRVYEIPLVHGGGNYHLNALGSGHATELIVNENPGLSSTQIVDYWQQYQNVQTTLWTPFPTFVDSTQHIDMWMQIIGDEKIMISDWPAQSGSTQDQICDSAAAYFTGLGWDVFRIPARSYNGTHYTYTNMVLCNDVAIIPFYNQYSAISQYNAQVLATYQQALPDKTVVQVDCDQIVVFAGVMHCIVMHVPEHLGGENPTAYLKTLRGGETLQPGELVSVEWIADDDVAVSEIDILLSTDGGMTFDTTVASGTTHDGSFSWTVPDVFAPDARLRVVARDADGNTGSDESETSFLIDGTPACIADFTGDGLVDAEDLNVLLSAWGCVDAACGPADLNGDGTVEGGDLNILLSDWGCTE